MRSWRAVNEYRKSIVFGFIRAQILYGWAVFQPTQPDLGTEIRFGRIVQPAQTTDEQPYNM